MDAGAEVSGLTPEQQQALQMARERLAQRRQPPAEEPGFMQSLGRQVGLTARAGGPTGVGAALGAAMGAPILGVGAGPGAGIGALAMNIIWMADKLGGTNYFQQLMDKVGLPKPETDEEKMAGAGAEALAGMGGMAGGAAGLLKGGALGPAGGGTAEILAQNPGLGAVSAASGAVAQESVHQNPLDIVPPELGGHATEQFFANVAGSALAPAGIATGRAVGRAVGGVAGDVGHAIGASFGRQKSVERLTKDAVRGLTTENPEEIRAALSNATTHVPGASPTVAEALAERNLQLPTKQVGGELIKLQDKISGHSGVADVLPSKMKASQAAIEDHTAGLRARTEPLRDRAMANARLRGGVDPQSIRWDLTIKEMDPAVRGHPLAMRMLQGVRRHLQQVSEGKKVDPEVLYSVRQTASSQLRKLQTENPYVDKAVGQKALRAIQKSIDKAMEEGGATGWRSYLKDFEEGMQPVNLHTERLGEAARIAGGVQGSAPEALVKETLPQIPTLLHRPTMFVNFVLKHITKDATTPVIKELATRLQDPQEFLRLMERPPGTPIRKATEEVLRNAAILTNLIQKHQAEQQSTSDNPPQ